MNTSYSRYQSYYQMKREAFGNLPELNLFFNSRTHQQAWRYLVSGIRAGEPYLLVSGDYGMGKTLLCMMLVRMLKQQKSLCCAYIPDPHTDYAAMLGEIAGALGLDTPSCNAVALHAMLNRHFRERVRSEVCYIVIDDAHELDPAILERLRALTNINNNGKFPFRLVMFAHTVVLDMLRDPFLVALGQRIRSRCLLTPLDLEEVREYIYYRLFKSGSFKAPSFTDDAIQEIYFISKGVPRIINTLAHACLIAGAEQGLEVISHGVVVAAAQTAGITPVEQKPQIHVTQQLPVQEKSQEDETAEEDEPAYGRVKKGFLSRRRKPYLAGSQGQHVAEPSRPLFLPAMLFALMLIAIIAAGGWEYYRLKRTHDSAEPLRLQPEEQQEISRDNSTRAMGSGAPVLATSREASPSGSDKPLVSVEKLSELPATQSAMTEQEKAQTIAASPPQPSATTDFQGATGAGEQKEADNITPTAPECVISLPPKKSVITVDLKARHAVLWQQDGSGIVAKDEGDAHWSGEEGLFLAGVDPRQGDFLFSQMNFMKGAAEKALPIRQWRNGSRLRERELVPVLALSSFLKLDEKEVEKARELPHTVAAWAEAWRRKDVDRMMSFYSDIVTLWDTDKNKPFVFTREEMTKRRSEVFAKCGAISLDLSDPVCVVDPRNPDFGIAVISQQYQSQTYADEGEKALFLRLEQDATGTKRQWKIFGQLWVPWKITQFKR